MKIEDPSRIRGKKGLAELKSQNIEELRANKPNFETWSQLIINHMSKMEFQ
jgi:hypothetical protein